LGKAELLNLHQQHGVELNEAGHTLFASRSFTTSEASSTVRTVEISVMDLGFPLGANINQVFGAAAAMGLALCPVELGPHLRIQYLDQPEGATGFPASRHRAPPGSVTVASEPLSADPEFPMGFYLRMIQGTPWLRGYRSDAEHIWSPKDHFVFVQVWPDVQSAT